MSEQIRQAHERLAKYMESQGKRNTRQRDLIVDAFFTQGGHITLQCRGILCGGHVARRCFLVQWPLS